MLKRLLASLAIVSLLAAATLLVYWWRSNHGHADEFTLGNIGSTQTNFMSQSGRVFLTVIDSKGVAIQRRTYPYEFRQVLGFCFVFPGLWVAIFIRSFLPRPPGGGLGTMRRLRN